MLKLPNVLYFPAQCEPLSLSEIKATSRIDEESGRRPFLAGGMVAELSDLSSSFILSVIIFEYGEGENGNCVRCDLLFCLLLHERCRV